MYIKSNKTNFIQNGLFCRIRDLVLHSSLATVGFIGPCKFYNLSNTNVNGSWLGSQQKDNKSNITH